MILITYYNIIKKFIPYLYLYCKSFTIKQGAILLKNQDILFKSELYIYDNGIGILNTFINYEYILTFKVIKSGCCVIEVLGTLNENKKFIASSNRFVIIIKHKNFLNIQNLIKQNMFYHIKYNKVNEDVFDYFEKLL